ncbi:hypothetical protein EV207_12235 [Scopulibacillus darangshiensis]|uniref:Uncharacterized protein n=1 Tax=Scopulibacillus darangshiensis TaxID=442528 RepID=A0A4R2NT12_9BACL|nr:hypothetical protein [Scopulibacillus darangshiensis]TCP24932.1 hypothetical protein EV207_12235 [Scopulibacillus darangshiensis]
MGKYTFYLEYDGKRTVSGERSRPEGTIPAGGISQAAKSFAKGRGLKPSDYDRLADSGYRVFYKAKKMFGKSKEVIYYVESDE